MNIMNLNSQLKKEKLKQQQQYFQHQNFYLQKKLDKVASPKKFQFFKPFREIYTQNSNYLFFLFNIYIWLILAFSLIKLIKILQIFSFLILIFAFFLTYKLGPSSSPIRTAYRFASYKSLFSKLYFLNLSYFNNNFLPNNFNLYHFLLFTKHYLILNYFNTIRVLKLVLVSVSTQKLKALFILTLILPPGTVNGLIPNSFTTNNNNNNNNNNKPVECPDESQNEKEKYLLEYDESLFNELNMHETLLNLYRSCYKDKYHESVGSSSLNNKSTKTGQNTCKEKEKKITPKDVLAGLYFSKEKFLLSQDVLDRIETICQSQVDYLDKIYLLTDYNHQLCGNVFRNSIKTSYLNEFILYRDMAIGNAGNRSDQDSSSRHSSHQNHRHRSYLHSNGAMLKPKLKNTKLPYLKNLTKLEHEGTTYVPEDINLTQTTTKTNIEIDSISDSTSLAMTTTKSPIKKVLNNCTLILLNIYLLAYKASCDLDDFAESLNHYDCKSNNFSVKSDCDKCQDAYKKWLCSSIIPYYYEHDKLAKPCQRYCYNVQNLCPFFRPVDNYGGQPVFHCRNVIQVSESKPDGYEDDDENYYDEDKYDDDRCYGECTSNSNKTKIPVDLAMLFREKLATLSSSSDRREQTYDSLIQSWLQEKSSPSRNNNHLSKYLPKSFVNLSFNSNGRLNDVSECFFNLSPDSSSSRSIFNQIFCLKIMVILVLIFKIFFSN